MATVLEARDKTPSRVLKLTIPAQVLTEAQTQRIYTQHSLSYPYIERNMSSNLVAEMRLNGKRWVWIVPHGGYTPTEHLMAMRWEPDYTPGPESIPIPEGEGITGLSADLVGAILNRPYNQTVVWSFHYSPYSFGQEGYQSVPTMFHPSVFGLPEFTKGNNPYVSSVKVGELTRKDKKAIRGGIYNRKFGSFLMEHTFNGHFSGDKDLLNRLFDLDQVQVDLHGIRIPARGSLEKTLRTPGFFEGFLQPLAAAMNRIAEELSTTFTDFNPRDIRRRIEEAVLSRKEPGDEFIQTALGVITRTPNLLEKSERVQNIRLLREKGYPEGFVGYLASISDRMLPDSGAANLWKRGFAYTFALYQDRNSEQCFMAISTAVENGPGGVVEGVLGAKLVRPPDPFSREQMETKKAVYMELVRSLKGYVVQNTDHCPVKDSCTDFRRSPFSYCMIGGIGCPNDQGTWDLQREKDLEARLDKRR